MLTVKNTPDEIMAEIARLEGLLSTKSGEGLLIWTGRDGTVCNRPVGGATVTVEWAINDQSYEHWYSTTEQAMAALHEFARSNNRVVEGFNVDLTVSPARVVMEAHQPLTTTSITNTSNLDTVETCTR